MPPGVIQSTPFSTELWKSSPYYWNAGAIEWAGCTWISQLTTGHIRVCWITHSPPLSIVIDLQSTRCVGGASGCPLHKPQVTTALQLSCGWNTVTWELVTAQDNLQCWHAMYLASFPKWSGNEAKMINSSSTTCWHNLSQWYIYLMYPSNALHESCRYNQFSASWRSGPTIS